MSALADHTPMPDNATPGFIYEIAQQLRDHIDAKHSSLRSSLESGFHDIAGRLDEHTKQDQAFYDRVLRIETEREIEKQQAIKRGAWAGILAAGGMEALIEGLKRLIR